MVVIRALGNQPSLQSPWGGLCHKSNASHSELVRNKRRRRKKCPHKCAGFFWHRVKQSNSAKSLRENIFFNGLFMLVYVNCYLRSIKGVCVFWLRPFEVRFIEPFEGRRSLMAVPTQRPSTTGQRLVRLKESICQGPTGS